MDKNQNYNALLRELHQFHVKSNTQGMFALLRQYLSLLLLFVFVYFIFTYLSFFVAIMLYIPIAILIAAVFWGFYPLMHEAIHLNLFKTKKLNQYIGELGSFLIFEDAILYKKLHTKHHIHLCSESDSEEALKKRWKISEKPSKMKMYIIRFFNLFYTLDFAKHSIVPFFTENYTSYRKYFYWLGLMCVFFIIPFSWLLLCYLIPMFIFYPYISFLSVLHEHMILEDNLHFEGGREDSFDCTQNNIHGWINRYILHPYNDGYHAVHHFDAGIPFHQLPKAHKYLKQKYNIKFIEASFQDSVL